ncbi:hypothetical protein [Allorhizocola rhizosphaerae]|uniref:hypothetical protein n=1 Tax=Allorhizocola rhizosphaerae TaxID=1872709 RepID=UPI000E3BC995|nr:hypothetical protein [Allorhizocola rhizosphaerae]
MSLPPTPYTLRELVAANLRRLRSVTAAQPDDVVRAAAQFGLEWTTSWYLAVERGQKPLSAEQLLALPPILTSALAYRVSLSDLLLGDGSMHFGQPIEGTTISLHYLRELVTAAPFRRSFLDFDDIETQQRTELALAQAAAEKMRIIVRANLGDVDVRALARAEQGATELESKLAKKLGVPDIVVIAAAASLWGHSMAEERDAMLNPGEGEPVPSKTTVSRKLTTAITQKLEEAEQAANTKAEALAAASNTVTAEFPLVQLNSPPRQPVEIASGSYHMRSVLRSPTPMQVPVLRDAAPPPQLMVPAQREPEPEPEPRPEAQPEPVPVTD